MINETEAQLISRALAGDRPAAGRLMERYRQAVVRTAYRALGNADDAWDVAQETLVYALLRLSDLRDRSRFSVWLRNITLSLCADYRRRRGTRRLGEPITLLTEASEEADYTDRLVIHEAVSHLSEAHRTTLLLHYVGGWSLNEVAALLEIPINTVRSRLMTAKRQLRSDLQLLFEQRNPMLTETNALSDNQTALITAAFPKARILSVQPDPEPWMPFTPRVRLALEDGTERTIDFRSDLDPTKVELFTVLNRLGIPGPRLVAGPTPDGRDGYLSLCEAPHGENLLLWALGGTPHRIRLATERAFEAIDRLQAVTDALTADPIGAKLPRRTLVDEAAALTSDEKWRADPWLNHADSEVKAWRNDPWFATATAKVQAAVAEINEPLVFTNYLHFFPNFVRIQPGADPIDEPLGWPGDIRLQANPLVEFVTPDGHFGDPLLDLAMVWIYDCYPFVHTGFVEQFLWRRNVSRRDFAPRLALRALQTIARQLPLARPDEGSFWDSLHGYVDQALAWM